MEVPYLQKKRAYLRRHLAAKHGGLVLCMQSYYYALIDLAIFINKTIDVAY